MKRIYLNGFQYFLKPSANVRALQEGEVLPEPTEEITLQANITLYRIYVSGAIEIEGEEPRLFLQEEGS